MITRCYLEITNVCNLNCVFCPKTERAKHTLTLDEFDALTSQLEGEVKFLYFHLMGEPFLHPLLPQFVLMARHKGFVPIITTNGTLLSRRADLLDALPHKIQISLHSHEGNAKENLAGYVDEVMPETYSSNNTSQMALQLKTILRQGGLALRAAYDASPAASAKGKSAAAAEAKVNAELLKIKESVLTDVYRILSLCLGVPPASFEWSMYDSSDKLVSTEEYTPISFYKKYVDEDLDGNYVMLMNDPTREYGKVYEIDYDRHVYDGKNWLYVNLPIERIREVAAASIKDNTAMYFSCDVGKFLNSKKGVLDLANYDYESLFNVKYTMDKRERVLTHASGSSHAMTLIAVDIKDGVPQKWMVENSWGADSGYRGCLIMTDQWFAEYMFRVVAEKKYVPADILEMLDQKPTLLPAWDPMFTPEQ